MKIVVTLVVSLFSDPLYNAGVHPTSPDLNQFNPRARPHLDASSAKRKAGLAHTLNHVNQVRQPKLVAMRPQTDASRPSNGRVDIAASFGDRRKETPSTNSHKPLANKHEDRGAMEMSWTPTTTSRDDQPSDDETLSRPKPKGKRKGIETFGAGMEKGIDTTGQINEGSRTGRSKRRSGVRSGSRNAFRKL